MVHFLQTPHKHLSGEGCPFCGIKNRADKQKLSTDEFIKKANEIHGIGTYDYCKVNYINSQTKVEIICQKHGSFWQTPNSHLCGELHTTLKSGGFLFSLQRIDLQI